MPFNKFSNTEQHLGSIAIIYISLLIFFQVIIFGGKTYQYAPDTVASKAWDTLINDAKAEGVYPLWNPYIFCGMPTMGSVTFYRVEHWYDDIILSGWGLVKIGLTYLFGAVPDSDWLVLYLVYGVGMYFLAFSIFKNKPISLMVALAAVYSSRVTILIMTGHFTKLATLAWMPFVFLIVDSIRKGKTQLLYLFLLALVLRLMIAPSHAQFIYYIYLALGIYFAYFISRAYFKKEPKRNLVTGIVYLVIATGLVFAMGLTQWLAIKEYNPYSIRGSNSIERPK
jgi:hypothetical protein